MKKIILLILPCLFLSQISQADVIDADENIRTQMGADAGSSITFDSGRSTLTAAETSALNDMIAKFRQDEPRIDEVKVFVWPDKRDDINRTRDLTRNDRKIVSERLKNIKNYLNKELNIRDVETFNLAQYGRDYQDLVMASGSTVQNLASNAPAWGSLSKHKGRGMHTETRRMSTEASEREDIIAMSPSQRLENFVEGNTSEALILVYRK